MSAEGAPIPPRLLFHRMIQTSGDSASGHHALIGQGVIHDGLPPTIVHDREESRGCTVMVGFTEGIRAAKDVLEVADALHRLHKAVDRQVTTRTLQRLDGDLSRGIYP